MTKTINHRTGEISNDITVSMIGLFEYDSHEHGVNAVGSVSGSSTVSLVSGDHITLTLTGDTVITVSPPSSGNAYSIKFKITQGGAGLFTPTFSDGSGNPNWLIDEPSWTARTASSIDYIVLTHDGVDFSAVPESSVIHVNGGGALVYTNPSGVEQTIAAETELPRVKSYSFSSFSGSSGTNYVAGYYDLTSADANLTQAGATVTHGDADLAYGAHAILVSGGPGSATGGTTGNGLITVSGTSLSGLGVRTEDDTEVIVADTSTMTLNDYYETSKKWIGQITYTLSQNGDRTTYDADFNHGYTKYDDWIENNAEIVSFEIVGIGGATDSSFDVALIKHLSANWVYHATTFVAPTGNDVCRLSTDLVTEKNLSSGQSFAWEKFELATPIFGSVDAPTLTEPNGFVVQIITGASGSVHQMDVQVQAII